MTEQELRLLHEELLRTVFYLEFCSGKSTKMAVSLPHLRKIAVVESDDIYSGKSKKKTKL